jgi:hypothetical protein
MPCIEVKELEAQSHQFTDRRRTPGKPGFERRKKSSASRQIGLFRLDYLIRAHRAQCALCQES